MEPICVHIAVLAIAENAASPDLAAADAADEAARGAGHRIIERTVTTDGIATIRDQLTRWLSKREIDVIIVTSAVESKHVATALAPLVSEKLPGFTDLFRFLAYEAIGTSAMHSNAEAACCGETIVFVLPASVDAVKAAMTKLILPQLDPNTQPTNLIERMPRLTESTNPDAIPAPVANEKTEAGAGPPPRLPARGKPRTAKNVVGKKEAKVDPFAADATKPIDLDRLEQQIALSSEPEPTKPNPVLDVPPAARESKKRLDSQPIEPPPPPEAPPARASSPPPATPAPDPPIVAESAPVISKRRTRPQMTVKVYPEKTSRNQRVIIGALATVFALFVIAIAWQLLSGGDEEPAPASKPVAVATPPPPPPAPTPPPAPVPVPVAVDAAALPEIDIEPDLVASLDAGVAVAQRPTARPTRPPRPPLPHDRPPSDAAVASSPPPPTAAPDAAVVANEAGCDETSCVMSQYAEPCCERYKPKGDFQPTTAMPDELTRTMVRDAVAKVKARISACSDRAPAAKGTVKVSVTVGGDGTVSDVSVQETPDPALGSCVAAAMQAAKFGKSKSGGSFTYPFVF